VTSQVQNSKLETQIFINKKSEKQSLKLESSKLETRTLKLGNSKKVFFLKLETRKRFQVFEFSSFWPVNFTIVSYSNYLKLNYSYKALFCISKQEIQ